MTKSFFNFFLRCTALTLIIAFHHAQAGSVCRPAGFSSFNAIPSLLKLQRGIGSNLLLYTQTVNDRKTTSGCTTSTAAELRFQHLSDALFLATDSVAGFNATMNLIDIRPTYLKIGYELRTETGDALSVSASPYSLLVDYFIEVSCAAGGLGAARVAGTDDEVRITGINGSSCQGNYTITYTIKIYQNSAAGLKTVYADTTGVIGFRGLRTRPTIYSDPSTSLNTNVTTIPGSDNLNFQIGISCTYGLSSTTVDLGVLNNFAIYQGTATSTPFTISTTGCTNTTGGTRSHGMYIFWGFSAADPSDSTILTNALSGANAATNVGVKISCNGTGITNAIAKDNTLVKVANPITSSNTISCTAKMVPMIGASALDIQGGSFRSSATLNFQFD